MSFWIYRKDETGKKHLWAIDVEPLVLMLPVGLLLALIMPQLILDPLGLGVKGALVLAAGFSCLLAAKLSLFRRGIWSSWGPHAMTLWWGRLYKLGYVLMFAGTIVLLLTYAATP
jgi:hypothetical protein